MIYSAYLLPDISYPSPLSLSVIHPVSRRRSALSDTPHVCPTIPICTIRNPPPHLGRRQALRT